MLGVFARLSAGQGLPAWEQLSSVEDRIRYAADLSVKAITIVAAATGVLLGVVLAPLIAIVPAAAPGRRHKSPNGPASARKPKAGRTRLAGADRR